LGGRFTGVVGAHSPENARRSPGSFVADFEAGLTDVMRATNFCRAAASAESARIAAGIAKHQPATDAVTNKDRRNAIVSTPAVSFRRTP
jgi:hypothetical protein